MKSILLGLMMVIAVNALGQDKQPYTYVMEDGTVLPASSLDSLNRAWGQGRVMLQHTAEDDKKGIMHVVKMSDAMMQLFLQKATENKMKLMAMVGKPAPAFSLKDMSGKSWTLDQLKGRVVVLNFWFTSCPPCIAEMPDLNGLVHQYPPAKVVFLALTFNDADQVKKFLETHVFDYTILPSSGEVDKSYAISSWPASFVIGKGGKILLAAESGPELVKQVKSTIDKEL
ncbi:hypothetical protein DCC81_18035 [Chitinophaga parva]|uniref:Thioredoxin domain-containing protein n=1 Tax=Chitinophaga parva TaxID=2169414 RepID=A0A2T7BIM4_9BACT|nr:TlpA disulfide reductase family protein [Chitinophaga parva]PUZ26139.1 hypothetical protein DCC81_18035 [Chitinophaga parva]